MRKIKAPTPNNIQKEETAIENRSKDAKEEILEPLQNDETTIEAFKEEKWFDVVTGKFYCSKSGLNGGSFIKTVREFNDFNSLFDYVGGGVYRNSCFYGYTFSNQEISRNRLNLKSINFDSFTYEKIDDYHPFRHKELLDVSNRQRAKDVLDWIDEYWPIHNAEELREKEIRFEKKFVIPRAEYVFMSILAREHVDEIKSTFVEYACTYPSFWDFYFDFALINYGFGAAEEILNSFIYRYNWREKIRKAKKALEYWKKGALTLQRKITYDQELQLYHADDQYLADNECVLNIPNYFGRLDELASYTDGDLSGADLTYAPPRRSDVTKYKIDDKTKLPISKECTRYEVKKRYDGEKFIVVQSWINDQEDTIYSLKNSFDHFFDFVHFLEGDISNADLLLCDGAENIKNLAGIKYDGIKVKSEIAKKLGLVFTPALIDRSQPKTFDETQKNEIQTTNNFLTEHQDNGNYYSGEVSYISDIHLLHRLLSNKCESINDVEFVLKDIARTIAKNATTINLIGGDTASSFDTFVSFLKCMNFYRDDKLFCNKHFFFTLGNHELWDFSGHPLKTIVQKYREAIENEGQGFYHLIQNNLFYFDETWIEISENELANISLDDLKIKTRKARIIIFGGIGFAGANESFNANNGVYKDALKREEEIKESAKFFELYQKVINATKNRNLIVLTHMPTKDWSGHDDYENGVVYVSGHTHNNHYHDDGKKRVYSDNQIGYYGKKVSLKRIGIGLEYDWFSEYQDGIYEITKNDYENFYHGIKETMFFNGKYEKLIMLKRAGTYMFFLQRPSGKLSILCGGLTESTNGHDLNYYYENLLKYSNLICASLSEYDAFQKRISSEIKKIGGIGTIHGNIIDIDDFNHLYLNPLDNTITPYFARSKTEKYVYSNVPSLLKFECPTLYENYEKLSIQHMGSGNFALSIFNDNPIISSKTKFDTGTQMYEYSCILRNLQYTTKYKIVRIWNDSILASGSEKMIDYRIFDQSQLPIKTTKRKVAKKIKHSKEIAKKPINREEKYKEKY